MKTLKKSLFALIERAGILGLRKEDLITAQEFVEYHEYGLGLDTITTQMYEYNIEIDQAFYETIKEIADKMKLPPESYSHMKELLRS